MPSPAEWPTEAPCVECGRRTPGLLIGNRCEMCRVERERRASRLAGRISLLAAALVAVWLILRPLPGAASGRLWAGVTVLVTYLLVRKIMAKALLETKWAGPQGT